MLLTCTNHEGPCAFKVLAKHLRCANGLDSRLIRENSAFMHEKTQCLCMNGVRYR